MGLKVSQLAGNRTAHTTVEYAGETVELDYYPDKLTPARESDFQDAVEGGLAVEAMLELIADLVASWDVTDDDGDEYAPNVDNLRQLPSAFLVACLKATREDMGAEGEAAPSVAGQRRGAGTHRGQAGPRQTGGR